MKRRVIKISGGELTLEIIDKEAKFIFGKDILKVKENDLYEIKKMIDFILNERIIKDR